MSRTKITCPKCKSTPIELIEIWTNAAIYYKTNSDGLWDGNDGIVEPADTVSHVEALCQCNHSWRLRGVNDILDLT